MFPMESHRLSRPELSNYGEPLDQSAPALPFVDTE
jgi:hypothetical protein